ncbi:hypothetical protein FCG26_00495 [Klebsiella pneumoniae]|uniref:ead/Ea22-like family protein n=1 Tax=Klebsiella pneumoniae TaxID=573 RepID=UPI0010AD9DE4|nr:ead/Ea22-like family protein [Klebsiella pneumoniae]MBH1949208.1 ead/Ea22-like family protein [Klebsiella pneumoniae]MBH1955122.1 ead/Ea22-like family protein [Klebsiella pneumoniae]TJY79944.1 hypothetical protein FCG31_18240 [Klebsiella pneumoniae]TJY82086.1 hypothetical protein FCG27_00495 [Klebsiella pneumoniae]TJY85660.1 hypothetical protein FCG26_00495 [Klebsiella pneumoniae]
MTTDITKLAQSLKAAANKAGADDWQAKKISGDFYVIRKGSYSSQCGYRTYQPIAEIDHKSTRDYVAIASPANILALVEALENSESRLHEVAVACATAEQALEKAQQQTTESENRVRKQNRHICELFDDNTALRQRIAGLESRTVTVKLASRRLPSDYVDGEFSNDDLAAIHNACRLECKVSVEKYLSAHGIVVKWEAE